MGRKECSSGDADPDLVESPGLNLSGCRYEIKLLVASAPNTKPMLPTLIKSALKHAALFGTETVVCTVEHTRCYNSNDRLQ